MDQNNHNHKHDKPDHVHPHPHSQSQHAHHPADDSKKHDDRQHAGESGHPTHAGAEEKKQEPAGQNNSDGRRKDMETIEQLTSQLTAANDKYLRLMAEFDNFKRRTAKEYQQLIEQANEKLMKDIIDVRENFERAFRSHREGADPAPFMDGMKMVFTKLDTVLHKHGLEVYCEAGQEFDPQLHDAMMKTGHDTIPEHHIAEVCEKGYKLRGKVIKHSRVVVSCGKPAAPQAVEKKAEAPAANGDETVFEVPVDPDESKTGGEQQEKS
jgi:molecular chaperone GrpE